MLLRRRSLLLMSGSMGLSACRSLPSTPMVAEVIHYEATIEPVIARRTLTGRLVVSIVGGDGALRLDAGGLTIAAVTEAGEPRAFEKTGTSLQIELAARPGRRDVEIDFHGAPTSGLVFDSEADQVHTVFATSQWMPCLDAPGVRATLGLTLVLPAGLVSAATGDPMPPRTLPDGRISTRWRLERPMPSYLYGFAAGRFVETTERAGPVTLRSLATPAFTAEQLVRIVKDTPDMIGFFERRSGVPYPDSRYTQVVLKGRAAQEMSGVSLVGERYGRAVLADETDLWLGAHELAHTWWGNGVTNRAWTHFWLNEGIATFMTAAYLEHRAGRAAYDTLIDASRRKYEALATAGRDHALVFDRWDRPSADDRSIVYDKGAYVVHRLRDELGEDAFWRGLAAYTRANWGRSVMTEDFRRAMQVAAGRDLGPFFERWVFA